MLDAARELEILQDVKDEGEFWEKRDALALSREVDSWNSPIGIAAEAKAKEDADQAADGQPEPKRHSGIKGCECPQQRASGNRECQGQD